MYKKVFALLFLLSSFQLLIAQTSLLKNFPEGYTPDEIGRRIAYRFVTEKHALHAGNGLVILKPSIGTVLLNMRRQPKTKRSSSFCKPDLSICLLPKRSCCPSRIMSI